jgi:acyl-CoA reductase-like NAD-dependent aldehyde dehydrogenase
MTNYQMFIGGEWVDSVSGETFPDINPASGEVYATVSKGDERDADRAMAAAYDARKEWANTPTGERAKLIYKASATLESRIEEFAEVLISEGGAMFGKAMFETTYTVDLLHTAGEDCRRILGETMPSDHDKLSMTIYRPRGTVVAISPWNFPLLLSVNKAAYALAAGNTVVLKPSSETPVIGLKIAELFSAAGLPPGVLNVVTGPGGVLGEALVQDDRTSLVTFTGETVTGRRIAELAGTKLKKYTLELGGKDPLIILADADMDYAVDAAAFGAFMHQGQICMSVERIIVEDPIAEEFARKLAAKAEKLPVGDPHLPTTVIGPLINDQQVQTVHEQVQDAVAKGARLLTGGSFEGRFYKPTVLADVTMEMKIFREETFGPTAPILKVRDEKEALAAANNSTYGLSSGVITNDLQKALFLAENLEAGMVHINDASVHDEPYCPFGGCKESGMGREGGRHSMEEMSEMKWVTIQRGKRHFPF